MDRKKNLTIIEVLRNMFRLKGYILLFILFVMQLPAMGENSPPVLNLKRPPLHIDNTKIYSVPKEFEGAKLVVKDSGLPSEMNGNDLIVTTTPTDTGSQAEPDDLKYALKTPVSGNSGLNNIMDDETEPQNNNSKRAMTLGLFMVLLSAGAGLIYLFIPKKKPENPVIEETTV